MEMSRQNLLVHGKKAENNVIYGLVYLSSLNPRHSKKRLDMRSYIPGNEADLYASYMYIQSN